MESKPTYVVMKNFASQEKWAANFEKNWTKLVGAAIQNKIRKYIYLLHYLYFTSFKYG
jgi:hypothetical protein